MIEHPLGILALLAALVGLSVRLERTHRAFAQAGAALLVILLGALASNLGLVPAESPVYDAIGDPVAPIALVLVLLRVNLAGLRRAGPTVLGAFFLGSLGTVAGCLAGGLAFRDRLGEEWWKLAGMFSATWIGGSANFLAVRAEYGLDSSLFGGANAADVLLTAIWMGATILLPRLLRRRLPARPGWNPRAVEEEVAAGERAPGPADLAALAAISCGTIFVSKAIAASIPSVPGVLWYTTIALLLAQVPAVGRLRGVEPAGLALIYVFLGAIGLQCDLPRMVDSGMQVFLFGSVALAIHGAVLLAGGRLLRLPVEALALGSNANIGGSTSALALARSQGWGALVLPGVVAGLVGNAIGTYAGVAVCEVLRPRG